MVIFNAKVMGQIPRLQMLKMGHYKFLVMMNAGRQGAMPSLEKTTKWICTTISTKKLFG